jgi:hypothetical protein
MEWSSRTQMWTPFLMKSVSHMSSHYIYTSTNGVVERKNRTLFEMARMMLDEYKTPRHFWEKWLT